LQKLGYRSIKSWSWPKVGLLPRIALGALVRGEDHDPYEVF
jgi:hypothetical protein